MVEVTEWPYAPTRVGKMVEVTEWPYAPTNNNKNTSLAPISSENPSSVVQQNQRIRHSRDHVQCKKSSTDGWRCQEAKEDRPF